MSPESPRIALGRLAPIPWQRLKRFERQDVEIETGQLVPKLGDRSVDVVIRQEHTRGLDRRANLDPSECCHVECCPTPLSRFFSRVMRRASSSGIAPPPPFPHSPLPQLATAQARAKALHSSTVVRHRTEMVERRESFDQLPRTARRNPHDGQQTLEPNACW